MIMRQRFMLIGNVIIPMDGLQDSHLQRKSASAGDLRTAPVDARTSRMSRLGWLLSSSGWELRGNAASLLLHRRTTASSPHRKFFSIR